VPKKMVVALDEDSKGAVPRRASRLVYRWAAEIDPVGFPVDGVLIAKHVLLRNRRHRIIVSAGALPWRGAPVDASASFVAAKGRVCRRLAAPLVDFVQD
jgi:hypothetical protein